MTCLGNKMRIFLFLLFLSVSITAFGQVQAVYDATVHQQSIINHEALVSYSLAVFTVCFLFFPKKKRSSSTSSISSGH